MNDASITVACLVLAVLQDVSGVETGAAVESRLVTNLKAGKGQTIVTYGTSLTAGAAWVGMLQKELGRHYPGKAVVINSGKGAMWSQWGVENLDARVIEKKPDTVFIEFSINDAYLPYRISIEQAKTNLINMVDRILKANPACEIILMVMNPPVGAHLEQRPNIKDYNQMYRNTARARKLLLVDHYPNWEKIRVGNPKLFAQYVPDGIHPVAEGCRNVILPELLAVLGLRSDTNRDAIIREGPQQQPDTGCDPRELRPLVFVITGESNSGGLGANAAATPAERAPRPCVQIINLTDGRFGFEAMQLGINNLREHAGLERYYAACHGFENELANAVESGAFSGRKKVYLIKTGQGGSEIRQWDIGAAAGYWTKFLQRISAAKRQLPANPQWVVWFSLGINDGIGHTPIEQWKQETVAHLKRIQAELPDAVIVMTQFQSMRNYPQIDAAIAEIAAEEPNVFAVDTTGAALADANHWNYAGLKTVTQQLVAATVKALKDGQ